MGFGLPWNFADATFKLAIRGDGRDDVYQYRPVSQQSFVAWSPPGALTTQSLILRLRQAYSSGNQTIVTGAVINADAPWNASYVVVVPPLTSTIAKTMKGANGDTGIPLIPWLPNVIALPSPLPNTWALIYNFGAAEDLDVYVF